MFKKKDKGKDTSNSSSSSSVNAGGSDGNMGLKELQQALTQKDNDLKMRDNTIAVLEQEIKKKDDMIKNLNRELDKCKSVLQPTSPTGTESPTTTPASEPAPPPPKKTEPVAPKPAPAAAAPAPAPAAKAPRARGAGISSEPVKQTAEEMAAPLKRHSKSGRYVVIICYWLGDRGIPQKLYFLAIFEHSTHTWCNQLKIFHV
jgi:FtsZ-interacting cell division protein ZipA